MSPTPGPKLPLGRAALPCNEVRGDRTRHLFGVAAAMLRLSLFESSRAKGHESLVLKSDNIPAFCCRYDQCKRGVSCGRSGSGADDASSPEPRSSSHFTTVRLLTSSSHACRGVARPAAKETGDDPPTACGDCPAAGDAC
eukprot:CAMPEP_0183535800 /NCGR_PEP_ID=MMETSP0371-20130417/27801_1 /TAXON_ID=268820 /ORGANISM="Peridinium aciculiferum, Strain PAER-2" /LENGTH=139 /DNA_ID=CAMNT_0025736311 /DNA_START=357 /DNA_END=776 /DNA_ORIENTATION=-